MSFKLETVEARNVMELQAIFTSYYSSRCELSEDGKISINYKKNTCGLAYKLHERTTSDPETTISSRGTLSNSADATSTNEPHVAHRASS